MRAHPAGGLVEKQQPRSQGIGDRNVEQLALALRETSRRNLALVFEPELTQHLERLPPHVRVVVRQDRHLHRLALAREDRQRDVVEYGEAVEQVDDLEAPGDPRLDAFRDRRERDVAVFQQDLPAVRL